VERFVPAKKGRKHVLRVISEILSFEPRSPHTNLGLGLISSVASRVGARWPSWSRTSSRRLRSMNARAHCGPAP